MVDNTSAKPRVFLSYGGEDRDLAKKSPVFCEPMGSKFGGQNGKSRLATAFAAESMKG
jgi:hypothetical protein